MRALAVDRAHDRQEQDPVVHADDRGRELPDRGLFERLSLLNGAAGRGPEVLARERASPVNEAKQQDPSGGVQNE